MAPAKTRQVYLGCVFTQHQIDDKGHPVRDWDSTTYVSSFQSIDEFGPCLRQEALRRGMGAVGKVVLLIDGACGLENMGRHNFKDCVQIVDFYHAMEHAGNVLEALLGKSHPDYKKRQRRWAKRLLKDKVTGLYRRKRVRNARVSLRPRRSKRPWATLSATFSRMQYGTFRKPRAISSARAWWRPAARRSLADAANNQACFGPNPAPKTSSRFVAFTVADGSTSSGNTGSIPTPHATTASPGRLTEEFCLTPSAQASYIFLFPSLLCQVHVGGVEVALGLAPAGSLGIAGTLRVSLRRLRSVPFSLHGQTLLVLQSLGSNGLALSSRC